MKRRVSLTLGFLLILCLVGCVTLQGTTASQTAKKQGVMWTDVYSSVYLDVKYVLSNPASTQAQKDLAYKKAGILTQMYPLLQTYMTVVDGGGTPAPADTTSLVNLINQLVSLAGGV